MKNLGLILGALLTMQFSTAQEVKPDKVGGYEFTNCTKLEALPVSNQFKSGTCWSFGGLSFFESEMIRMGMPAINLSEMYIVRHAYEMKAQRYLRMQGKFQFGPGGQFHDIIEVAKLHGFMSEADYNGKPVSYGLPVHAELDAITKSMVSVAVKRPNKILSESWWPAYNSTLNSYLGEVNEDTDKKGMKTLKSTGLNLDNYIELTSFTHLEDYKKNILFIPDNWTMSGYYNLPLQDLLSVLNNALNKGYTVAWDADVSDNGFSFKNGLAVVPTAPWGQMSKVERDTIFNSTLNEAEVTAEMRQTLFDNFETTDDHLMHITGKCKDQNGNNFYYTKNSWGTNKNSCEGFLYTSESYFKLKTIAIMVHKDAIPKAIRKKLGI
ncbi:MAG: aminopeptidase [Salibacteraceae bacterium]|nr:aminopeptidase [Salibacteraceae bacterium]|tara:strand:+ start:15085 stop:16224 length:1140 start_codon:yes stop_codon:yes gene_type:complete